MAEIRNQFTRFLNELVRREVLRVALAATMIALLVGKLVAMLWRGNSAAPTLYIVLALCVVALSIGAWFFEWTPRGMVRRSSSLESAADGRFTRRLNLIALGALLLFSVAFVFDLVMKPAPMNSVTVQMPHSSEDLQTVQAKPRLAILAFAASNPQEEGFFADAAREEILGLLAGYAPDVDVVALQTMNFYQATARPDAALAGELGATRALLGSVTRNETQVHLALELVDSRSGATLWSQKYERALSDMPALLLLAARDVAGQLQSEFRGPQSAPARDPAVYDLFFKARIARRKINPGSSAEDYRDVIDFLDEAIKRDETFGRAFLERARVRIGLFAAASPKNPKQLEKAEQDLDKARAILGDDPMVLAVSGLYWRDGHRDYARALGNFEAAEIAGLHDPDMRFAKAILLTRMGRFAEAAKTFEELAALDFGNLGLLGNYQAALQYVRKPAEALRVLDIVIERFGIGVAPIERGRVLFNYTGRTDALRAALDKEGPSLPPPLRLQWAFDALRFEQRYPDLKQFFANDAPKRVPGPRTELQPAAILDGWTDLLLGKAADAKGKASEIAQFVERSGDSEDGRWFLKLLSAQARLFASNKDEAVVAAREALALMPREADAVLWRYAATVGARVLAWGGAQEEAVTLLEQLSGSDGGLAPAEIARDPLYEVPLASNARFKTLAMRLESEIAQSALK